MKIYNENKCLYYVYTFDIFYSRLNLSVIFKSSEIRLNNIEFVDHCM